MQEGKPSVTAQHVALARTHLNRIGAIDDPYAHGMLRPKWRRRSQVFRLPGVRRIGRRRTLPYLAARTLWFDQAITEAMDAGVPQVVILGAGYDSRAWRLARDQVRFVEVDHPATQHDKQGRAPAGGPTYVAADLGEVPLAEALAPPALDADRPVMWVAEGLTMYLHPEEVEQLFRSTAELAAGGSRLVTNFGVGFDDGDADGQGSSARAKAKRRRITQGGEAFRFEPSPDEVVTLLDETGWTLDRMAVGSELGEQTLQHTDLPSEHFNPRSFSIRAHT